MPEKTNQATEVGFDELVGRDVVVICAVYIYAGKLVAVGPDAIKLEGGQIVYETGPWQGKAWADAQQLPFRHTYVARSMIESFGEREIL